MPGGQRPIGDTQTMTALTAGYAMVSTSGRDTSPCKYGVLAGLGVHPGRVCADRRFTGINGVRPGRREAMAASRAADTLVVTRLDRLARSVPDARELIGELTTRESGSASAGPSTAAATRSDGCCPIEAP